ncbi:MAG: ATP-grasp domain-containing protein [Deltaproteobacteria bacterium]|nr:ATP-grasp domain-containing protein [Deltaproteobacteria bacterium]
MGNEREDQELSGVRVLVTGAGGPAGYGVLEALARSQPGLVLHAGDMSPLASGLYCVPPEHRHVVPRGDAPEFFEHIVGVCRRHRIDLVIPTVDSEMVPIADGRAALFSEGARVASAASTPLRMCLDKYALSQALSDEIPVGAFTLWRDTTDPLALSLPLIAKPRSGSGGRGIVKIDHVDQLLTLPRDGSILLTEYLPGAEYSVDVFRTQAGEVLAAVPRERLRVDSGIAITARTLHDPELERYASRAVSAVGLVGVANVQFRRDRDGTPKLLEINPRFPGTMALTIAAGVDMPTLAVLDAMNRPMPGALPFEEIAVVRRWQTQVISCEELLATQRAAPSPGLPQTALAS